MDILVSQSRRRRAKSSGIFAITGSLAAGLSLSPLNSIIWRPEGRRYAALARAGSHDTL
jgi:hypothetical protein